VRRGLRRISLWFLGSTLGLLFVAMTVHFWGEHGWWAGILVAFVGALVVIFEVRSLDKRLRSDARPYIPPFIRFRG
jgi:uncharacterized membrane protein YeaQ/YmgE (transglycosylase-associated protein family)